jgi:hypothetical protein
MKTTFRTWIVYLTFAGVLLPTSTLRADAPNGTKAIEQDWRVELYSVSDPTRLTAPLFITSFSIPSVSALFQTTWNHRDEPIVEEGGIQLQAYKWDSILDEKEVLTPPWKDKLSNANESVSWTQRLHIAGVDYVFTVKNIVGTTWGSIPGPYAVKRRFLFWAPPLEGYSYQEIANNSGIIMGTNRFKKLSLTETRFYDLNGALLLRDTQEKVLFSQPESYEYFEFKRLDE